MDRSTVIGIIVVLAITGGVIMSINFSHDGVDRDELAAQNSRVLDLLEQKSQEASHDWDILEHYLVCIERMNMAAGADSAVTVSEARRDAIAHRDSLRMNADSARIKYESFQQWYLILGDGDTMFVDTTKP